MSEFEFKPWGSYKVIHTDHQCRVKILKLEPNKEIKPHAHYERDEQWTVVIGEGKVVVGNVEATLREGDRFFVPRGSKHSIKNTSVFSTLKIVEIQTGNSFTDEDIFRFDV